MKRDTLDLVGSYGALGLTRSGIVSTLLIVLLASGCSASNPCLISPQEASSVAALSLDIKDESETPYRVTGLLRARFESSTLIPQFISPSMGDLEKFSFLKYCVRTTDECRKALRKRSRATGVHRKEFAYYALVDVLVHFEGESTESDCTLGQIRVIRVISSGPARSDLP
jgi:hypothetical protein